MINFYDTKTAFEIKSTKQLKKAHWLFNSIKNPQTISLAEKALNFAQKMHLPYYWAVRPAFKQFCGGENLMQCARVIEKLYFKNVYSILDYSVEGGGDAEKIRENFDELLQSIRMAANRPEVAFAVFKPSALVAFEILEKVSGRQKLNNAEQNEFSQFEFYFDKLCNEAFSLNTPILVDAEDFCIQKAIDEICIQMMQKYNKEKPIVYNTLQMYRTDRVAYLKEIISYAAEHNFKPGIKLVRGAYMEKERELALARNYPSPIHATKKDTDNAFNQALDICVANIENLAIFCGTHNEESCLHLVNLITTNSLSPSSDKIFFSQLYGMSDHLSFNLAANGYKVAKYIPYGPIKSVIPYLLRRAQENTSAGQQTGRELMLIQKELRRRKKEK